MYITTWNKSIWKDPMLYNSNYMEFWKSKPMVTVKWSVIASDEQRGGNEQMEQRKYFEWYYNGVSMSLHICQPRKYIVSRVNHNVN